MPERTLLLVAVLLLAASHLAAAECVGFALASRLSPYLQQSVSIAQGLSLWHLKDKRHTISLESADTLNGSLTAAYLSLPSTCVLIGPVSSAETIEVAEALIAAGRSNTVFASLDADLVPTLTALGLRAFSLAPPAHAPAFHALQELADEESYVWTLLGSVAPSDQRILNETKTYLETEDNLYRTVQHVATFDPANTTSLNAEVEFISRLRPRPNVLMLTWEDLGLGDASRVAALTTLINTFAQYEVQPRAIWSVQPLAYSSLERRVQRRIKYWSSNALWSRTLDLGSRKSVLGTAKKFADAYRDEYGVWPDDFAALGAASALVAAALRELSVVSGFKVEPECFWGPIELAANGTNVRAQWRWVQYLPHHEQSIEFANQNDASRNSLSYPGRWSWRSYSFDADAIAGLVLAAVLSLIALIIFVWTGVKAVRSYLYGHEEKDEEEEEKDQKKGKKRD